MKFKNCMAMTLCVIGLHIVSLESGVTKCFAQTRTTPAKSAEVALIAAEELKAKFDRNEPVTVLDVRSTKSFIDSDNKISGSFHVKLRRLRHRLGFAPLKNVPKNSEVVTYCACPADEASINAARILIDAGFNRVRVLKGGWHAWQKISGPVDQRRKG